MTRIFLVAVSLDGAACRSVTLGDITEVLKYSSAREAIEEGLSRGIGGGLVVRFEVVGEVHP